ncbi:exodeoxyribonuclease V subunit alpha [Tepidimonas charontis]|uniref:RecBCD enzyme subunit RecD n=1 Tax=Tepidimonas charontis TaxID=2267262 RepID=A0A554XFE4_9BURK|nr:exodeoxyribonuclease V subunit alpha [Tepidimonas charontis]TSE34551.1 RecBCD enzyme subunit RecD [Tepidimonas charontis]
MSLLPTANAPEEGVTAHNSVMAAWLQRGLASGELRPADVAFAHWIAAQAPSAPPWVPIAAACLSRHVADGHVCLPLQTAPTAGPCRRWLMQQLADCPTRLDHGDIIGNGTNPTPLVRDGARLYLWRHWYSEQAVARALAQRLLAPGADTDPTAAARRLRPWLDALFAPNADTPAGPDWQALAVALATRQRLAVITGGPGTGKTTTVVRLLAVLQGLRLADGAPPWRIGLAAPTGKAAARLAQSVAGALAHLPWCALPLPTAQHGTLRASLPTHATTVHRLIGRHGAIGRVRHDADHPLWLDALVIDEASMLDLELLHETLQALPPDARLILLGDRDQLASVEAGAVMAQLCERARSGHYPAAVAAWLHSATGQALPAPFCDDDGTALDAAVVMLRHSRRFGGDSGIGQWAAAVNDGDAQRLVRLAETPSPDVRLLCPPADDSGGGNARLDGWDEASLWEEVVHAWGALLQAIHAGPRGDGGFDADAAERDAWARAVLQRHATFQVLCALRDGPWGVQGLNQRVLRALQRAGLLDARLSSAHAWFAGRPVLVTRNAPALGLMNGDLGLVLPYAPPGEGHSLRWRLAFAAPELPAGVRWALPAQLDGLQTAFALTVHKAQGSEFDHVWLALPALADSPLLTRELLYTGITRARQRLTLVAPGGVPALLQACTRRAERAGGLRAALLAAMADPAAR